MDVALVQPSDLSVQDGKLMRHVGADIHRIDVLYARMDEDMLLSSAGYDGAPPHTDRLAVDRSSSARFCRKADGDK